MCKNKFTSPYFHLPVYTGETYFNLNRHAMSHYLFFMSSMSFLQKYNNSKYKVSTLYSTTPYIHVVNIPNEPIHTHYNWITVFCCYMKPGYLNEFVE